MNRVLFFLTVFMVAVSALALAETGKTDTGQGQPYAASVQTQPSDPVSGGVAKQPVLPSFENSRSQNTPQNVTQWAELYETDPSEQFATALWNAVAKTGALARTVGDSITGYVKERQLQVSQKELLDNFYFNCRNLMRPLNLTPAESSELLRRIEQVYIEDSEKGLYQLDIRTFRDLPNIIKKEHAEMLLAKTKDGSVTTFHPNGTVKARWRVANGRPDGTVVTYYDNGEILYIDYYRDGEKVLRRKYDKEGKLEFEQDYQYGPLNVETPLHEQKASEPNSEQEKKAA